MHEKSKPLLSYPFNAVKKTGKQNQMKIIKPFIPNQAKILPALWLNIDCILPALIIRQNNNNNSNNNSNMTPSVPLLIMLLLSSWKTMVLTCLLSTTDCHQNIYFKNKTSHKAMWIKPFDLGLDSTGMITCIYWDLVEI